jgi:ferredoxin
MINGKAVLTREDYCDGLGDCLPACPADAIHFEMREAPAYDEAAVLAAKEAKEKAASAANGATSPAQTKPLSCGCPGSAVRTMNREPAACSVGASTPSSSGSASYSPVPSQLTNFPIQIKLAPINAPFFNDANLLIAADCTAYAYGNFHQEFIRNHVTLIGCPKLDEVDYAEKLTQIIAKNNIKSVTVTRMQVPCCGGLENAVKRALMASGKFIPWRIVTISHDGRTLD